jgi:hypothetical protein
VNGNENNPNNHSTLPDGGAGLALAIKKEAIVRKETLIKLLLIGLIIIVAACATANVPQVCPVPKQAAQKPYSSSHKYDGFWRDTGRMLHDETGGRQ